MIAEPPETQHTYTTGSSGGSQAETVDTHPRENSNPARSNRVRSRSIGSVGSTPITTEQRPELGRPGLLQAVDVCGATNCGICRIKQHHY